MRRLARPYRARARGAAHSLRSAFNHFSLVEPFPYGKLYFKRGVDRPVCVYVIGDKLFVLASELQAFAIVPAGDDGFCLADVRDGRLYSIGFAEDDATFSPAANRTQAQAWEVFELRAPPVLDRRECAAIARIEKLTDRLEDTDFPATLAGEVDIAVIGACLATAPGPRSHAAGAWIADDRFAEALAEAFPQDAHAKAFRRLFDKEPTREREIALGDLWLTGLTGGLPSLPFVANCHARELRQPTQSVCILATLRNEAPYIVEWLAYHRSIGIEHFFIYENDSQDGSRELVDQLADLGLIDIVHNVVSEGGNAQSTAYVHALSLRPELLDFEWCIIIDLDEFLLLNDGATATVDDFLTAFRGAEVDAIAVNWVVYGPNGRLRRDCERPVMDVFNWRHPRPDRHIKSIVRPQKFFTASAHYPYRHHGRPFAFVDPLGRPHVPLEGELAWSACPDESRVGLAHYAYKSLDEFLLKWSRNRGDNPRRHGPTSEVLTKEALEAFVAVFPESDAQSTRMRDRSAKAKAEARRIRALPGIAAIEIAIDDRYGRNISSIREMFLDCPALRSSRMGPQFRELIHLAAESPAL